MFTLYLVRLVAWVADDYVRGSIVLIQSHTLGYVCCNIGSKWSCLVLELPTSGYRHIIGVVLFKSLLMWVCWFVMVRFNVAFSEVMHLDLTPHLFIAFRCYKILFLMIRFTC